MHELLQIWAGLFYLLNKIFFSRAERSTQEKRQRSWRIWSWSVYLIGLPAWIIIFVSERNWMAAAVEAGGAPSMILGLIIAIGGLKREPLWLDWIARIAAITGIGISLYDFGGITTINQVLELFLVTGFLFGTYLLAKKKPSGYLWFLLMNGSNATLMWIQGYPWLMVQQAISFFFVLDAYVMYRRMKSKTSTQNLA